MLSLLLGMVLALPVITFAQTTSTDRLAGLTTSVAVKPPVKAVSISNLTLEGEQTVNGVAVVTGDRVLVKSQSNAVENGIYIVDTSEWERSADFDGALDVVDGTLVVANNSTDVYYRVTTNDPITIGSTAITFETVAGAVSASSIGLAIYPRTAAEITAGVTPSAYQYPQWNVLRYGATGDGVADDTAEIQAAIDVCEAAHGGEIFIPIGRYKITATLIYTTTSNDDACIFRGQGSHMKGSVIVNTTNDVEAFFFDGDVTDDTTDRADRIVVEDLRVEHSAATKYAFRVEDAPYLFMNRVKIEANSAGYGCVFLGTTAVTPNSDNFLSAIRDTDCRNFTTVGIRVNSKGHTIELENNKVGGGSAGARDGWFQSEGVNIRGGQWGGSPLGIQWDNQGAGDIEYGMMSDVKIEGVGAGEIGVKLSGSGGTPRDFAGVTLDRLGVNMAAMSGTFVQFDYSRQSRFIHPVVRNPTSGTGILAEWTANSDQCELIVDYEAAQAALTVNASATRATKRVTGEISRSQVANITTYANLTTILQDGVDELPPGFVPVHNGTGWNYWLVTLADDAASSFTLPAVSAALVRSRVTVLSDGGVTFAGVAFVDADSGGAAISAQGVGADFNTTTGALAGTTGTDVKVTLSAHTDGKIYLENRSGASRDFTVLIEPVIFGTDLFEPTNAVNDDFWLLEQAA
jgi:hypothetical protein